MATITRLFGLSHLRSEPSFHALQVRRGKTVRSGRGLAFWFWPLVNSIAEVPCDDRDETFLFHARSRDYQDVTTQGVITWRVKDPTACAARIDFAIDMRTGRHLKTPLEQLSQLLIQSAQQHAWACIAAAPVRELLAEGVARLRERIAAGLAGDANLAALGLEIASVRIARVAPTAELEKALQAPTHEAIQQTADEAVFQRRALAVEKERAIQENEMQNRIELARREEQLIATKGQNERMRAKETAEARRIEAEAHAARRRLGAAAKADELRAVEGAKIEAEREQMAIYRDLPPEALLGLAAREFAGKLQRIEHLNLTPELLTPLLANVLQSGAKFLDGPKHAAPEQN
ncbi:MAG: SPFH domain-containing protein [Planctomycetota bacterium]|nr:SPFH domain-containing protein [Planctomycetota bacterium]